MRSYRQRFYSGGSSYRGKGYAGRWDAAEAASKAATTREIVNGNITKSPPACPPASKKEK